MQPKPHSDSACSTDYGNALVTEQIENLSKTQGKQPAVLKVGTDPIVIDDELSYRQLAGKSAGLAQEINLQLPDSGELIALSAKRSIEMITGMIGILQSGKGYVPIDPELPADRFDYFMQDSGANLILTDDSCVNSRAYKELKIDQIQRKNGSRVNSQPAVNELSPAYLIYTSGSTGKPKGVLVNQGNLAYSSDSRKQYYGSKYERFLLVSPFTFDSSVAAIFGTLTSGGTLILPEHKYEQNIPYLSQLIQAQQVTHILCLPSLYGLLLEYDNGRLLQSLTTVIVAGEECPVSLVGKHFQYLPNCELHNEYGPTEATVWASVKRCQPEDSKKHRISIGNAIQGTTISIRDQNLLEVATEEEGEICIAGPGLAIGYHNHPKTTESKFVLDPKSKERIYRSGDLGMINSAGEIEFRGRIDNQVKVRGHRVELEEIEAIIRSSGLVDQFVVVAVKDDSSVLSIVAFYTTKADEAIQAPELEEQIKAVLKQKLPKYMIPAFFCKIDHMPFLSNGKINRKQLAKIELKQQRTNEEYIKPKTGTEQGICEIWEEVLNIKPVGLNDNFFELGGHSLSAMRIISRLSEKLGLNIHTPDIFENPTPGQLASLLRVNGSWKYPSIPSPINQKSMKATAMQQSFLMVEQLGRGHTFNGKSAYHIKGSLSHAELQSAFKKLIRRHKSLRTRFLESDGVLLQEFREQSEFNLVFHKLEQGSNTSEKVDVLLKQLGEQPFDIENDTLIRACLIELKPDEHILAIVIHHTISDGWSLSVMMRDLLRLIESSDDKPPRIQYDQYTAWLQLIAADDKRMHEHRSYWSDKLGGQLPKINLHPDTERPMMKSNVGANHFFWIDQSQTKALAEMSNRYAATLFMTLNAIIKTILHKYSGETDIVIGTPIAGRNLEEFEDQVGLFINLLPLRDEVKSDTPFPELLKSVKNTTIEAYEHQDYPCINLITDLGLEVDLSRSVGFDVLFTFHNNDIIWGGIDAIEGKAAELNIEPIPFPSTVNRFDLSFDIKYFDEQLEVAIEYNTDLFSKQKVSEIEQDFRNCINQLLTKAETKIKDLIN